MSTTAAQLVDANDLEEQLARLRVECADPTAGLFGPQTLLWEVNREALVFLGSGRAALLQLAHPYVAEAIDRFSSTQTDPFGRFHRTFRQVFAMVWGDLDAACTAARRVHTIHTKIEGTLTESLGSFEAGQRYHANEPDALLWVHATLWETSVLVYETFVRPLDMEEKERYYTETRRFAGLFGLQDPMLPETWESFLDYNEAMWRELEPGRAAREIGAFLFEPHGLGTGPPLRWLRAVTGALMPAPLREPFGLTDTSTTLAFRLPRTLIRGTRPLWPRRLRYVPPYLDALRRIRGDTRRDRIGEWLTKLWRGPEPGKRSS